MEWHEKAVEMYKDDYAFREIAKELGFKSHSNIIAYIKSLGICREKDADRLKKPDWIEEAINLFKQGISYSEISKAVGVNRTTVTRSLNIRGYKHDVSSAVADANKAKNKKRINWYTCEHCGEKFRYKGAGVTNKYCCRQCYFDDTRMEEALFSEMIECEVCGEWFIRKNGNLCCSTECRKEKANSKYRERMSEIYYENQPEYTCKYCGVIFMPDYGSKKKVFCSDKCLKANYRTIRKQKQRAEHYGVYYEFIDVLEVYKRSGWVCGICGESIDRKLKHPHPKSISLDHIIPMSIGGPHSYENVQPAHFNCNSKKGNRRYMDQGDGQMMIV